MGRNGSLCANWREANAISIRIGRALSGRDKVAVCGYHGWHDWYLAANIRNEGALDKHLLKGLPIQGVPKSLEATNFPFRYGDLEGLKELFANEDIGIVKMEVSRSTAPDVSFLAQVRELANNHNAVLIFDEYASGFRETFGGIHLKYGVNPDLMTLGKALGNGYAITAVLGTKEVMEAGQSSFISSTFWTERIGSVAALETLNVMEREKSWIKGHFRSERR